MPFDLAGFRGGLRPCSPLLLTKVRPRLLVNARVEKHELKQILRRIATCRTNPYEIGFTLPPSPLSADPLVIGTFSTASKDSRSVVFAKAAIISPVRPFPQNTKRISDADLQRNEAFPLHCPLAYLARSGTIAARADKVLMISDKEMLTNKMKQIGL